MGWSRPIPDTRTDEQRAMDDQRARIRATVPRGWAGHFNRLTYGFEAAAAAGDPAHYGICGHGAVCLMTSQWHHPYPLFSQICDDPPAVSHVGIL